MTKPRNAYYAVFVPNDGKYSVFFPDLPGLFPWGESFEEAFGDAVEALEFHLEGLADDGDPIPAPSGRIAAMEQYASSRAAEGESVPEGSLWQLIPAPDLAEQQTRVNVSFKKYTLDMIDKKAAAAGMTRSGFLAAAARAFEDQQHT